MDHYDRVADLPLRVESVDLSGRERDTSSGFVRRTTTVELTGAGATGRGEDVTYDAPDHEALAAAGPSVLEGLVGEYEDFEAFSRAVDAVELFPEPPERESARHYRRWAVESAGLDLALRQSDRSLGAPLGRDYDPVRFVVSTRLESFEPVERLRDAYPEVELKLDPTEAWDEALADKLAATGRVRVLDLKGHYRGTSVDAAADPELYRLVAESFPEAILEDPAVTDETRPVLEPHRDRIAWDAPVTGVESLRELPFEPRWVNVKPSRFGTVRSLFDTVDYCLERDVGLYGGGQFELDVGRGHLQALASLFYPDAPNDVAPGEYNDPEPAPDLPRSPLAPPDDPAGLSFR